MKKYLRYTAFASIVLIAIFLVVLLCREMDKALGVGAYKSNRDKETWTYSDYMDDIEAHPQNYRMLRIECSLKGETKLLLLQRHFRTTSVAKTEEPAFDKCVITLSEDKK